MVKIGFEWEFWAGDIDYGILEDMGLYKEYYSAMWEANNFLFDINTKENLNNAIEEVIKKMKEIKNFIVEEGGWCELLTSPYKIDYNALIFNGLHIHISFATIQETKEIFKELVYNNYPQWYKFNYLSSPRVFLSHHIWGGERSYGYKYKMKQRFKPFIYSNNHNTIEFRLFDIEDLWYSKRREKLINFLWNIFEKKLPNSVKKYPIIFNGEDLLEIKKEMKKYFVKKSIFSIEDYDDIFVINSPNCVYKITNENEIFYERK